LQNALTFARKLRSARQPALFLARWLKWLAISNEPHSLSFVPAAEAYDAVAAVLATITHVPIPAAAEAVRALQSDRTFMGSLADAKREGGRRLHHDDVEAWGKHIFYAGLVRLAGIGSVLELGTYLGFGTRILARAAGENALVTTLDLRQRSPSFLERGPDRIRRLTGDVRDLDSIPELNEARPELVIYDCVVDDTIEEALWRKVLLRWPDLRFAAANWHGTGVLMRIASENGMRYLPVPIPARDHWYRGATIGIAWREG
jgi:hypothetical protein